MTLDFVWTSANNYMSKSVKRFKSMNLRHSQITVSGELSHQLHLFALHVPSQPKVFALGMRHHQGMEFRILLYFQGHLEG